MMRLYFESEGMAGLDFADSSSCQESSVDHRRVTDSLNGQ